MVLKKFSEAELKEDIIKTIIYRIPSSYDTALLTQNLNKIVKKYLSRQELFELKTYNYEVEDNKYFIINEDNIYLNNLKYSYI